MIKNKVIIYLTSRYLIYFIQFVTSLVIAAELGPYYMGIWGFLLLLIQYFQQFHFGISNSFNVLYVHHRDNQQECNNYIGNSMVLLCYVSLLAVFFFLYHQIVGINAFEKYLADKYIFWVCVIAILQYFVQFFINLFRVKNQLNRVAFCQSIIVFLNFICVFIFRGEALIIALVTGYVLGNILCIIIALTSGSLPSLKNVNFNVTYQKQIFKKGLYLFLYNSCFYFIIISIRTIISGNYTVEEFGLFTFSFTLAHAISLILDAFLFIIFPKVLYKLSSNNYDEIQGNIQKLRNVIISSAHLLVYAAIAVFPAFLSFFPEYSCALTSLNVIALSILMSSNSMGYMELLIAQNMEKRVALMSFIALVINCMIAIILVYGLHVDFSYVMLASMITYVLFTTAIMYNAQRLIKGRITLSDWMPFRLIVPYLIALTMSFTQFFLFPFSPLLIFLLLNWRTLFQIVRVARELLYNPEKVNL